MGAHVCLCSKVRKPSHLWHRLYSHVRRCRRHLVFCQDVSQQLLCTCHLVRQFGSVTMPFHLRACCWLACAGRL
jgi:hypothetical protein